MKVLLTGATGFLGGHIARALMAAGHEVRALSRGPAPGMTALGVEAVRGDLSDPESLGGHMDGIEAVIHAAGGGKVIRTRDFYTHNTNTTAALASAAREAGIRHFILVSSLAARGPDSPAGIQGYDRPVSHYGRSKLLAENLLLRQQRYFAVTILRPPGIYGPGDTRFLLLYRQVLSGVVPLPAAADKLSLVWGPDCADALTRLLERKPASGRIYTISDGGVWSSRQILNLIARSLQRHPKIIAVPLPVLAGIAGLSAAWDKIRQQPGFLTPDKIRDLAQGHWTCNADALRVELGWQPSVQLPEGVQQLAQWYREQGWI